MLVGDSTPYVEAEYSDGYVHREDGEDVSPYVAGQNIFADILHRRPEDDHGKMTRFSLITSSGAYHINWQDLPDNARPIRFKHMERNAIAGSWVSDPRIITIDFGYQYTDGAGRNQQEVITVR